MRIFFILFITITAVYGQTEFDKTKYDFGSIEYYHPRFVDFKITNKGDKQEWMLRVEKSMDIIYIPSNQFMSPDSSIYLRFQVNPKKKGKFKYDVKVYVSDKNDPINLVISGNLISVEEGETNSYTACPDFNSTPGGKDPLSFDLTVITIDALTGDELEQSKVTMLQNGYAVWTEYTDKNGRIKEDATIGLSYFYARHTGYYPKELGVYVNSDRNEVIIPLERDERTPEPELITSTETDTTAITEITIDLEEELTEIDTSFLSTIDVPESMEELEGDDFTEQNFSAINVVFILDVSSSMKQADKLELMKYSLNQLVDMLRPQDKVGIVTYSSNAAVLLKPTSASNKTIIKDEVAKLEAKGFTSGGLGIDLGLKQAKKGYIKGGVNHVIVITDGAFNRNSSNYKKTIKKYQKKGINMSVVGVKNKETHREDMIKAADVGGGHYIPINDLTDAQHNLKQEIRVLTYKH